MRSLEVIGAMAVKDVVAAWVAYREASRTGIGVRFDLSGRSPALTSEKGRCDFA
jgi:hypothetical protein